MSEAATLRYRDRTGVEAQVRFTRRGKGPALVLVHGVGMAGLVWEPQVAALCRHYDVIALDMLGHGGSSLPPADARLSDYADQLLALLDGLGIARAHVVGHSMGALVALEFALTHPARVLSVAALNAVFCRSAEQRRAVESRLAAIGDLSGPQAWAGTIARWFGEPVPPAWRAAAEMVHSLLDAVDPLGYERTYRLFASSDEAHRDRLAGLAVPALFFTGAEDPNSNPAMSQAMARLARRGECEILADERHMMSLTAEEAVNRRLLAFLGRADAAKALAPAGDFDPRAFRSALGSFLTGVTVVATLQEDGEPRGFTANSFTSVSLDPPLVLVCIAKTASSCPVFSAAGHFSVNILAERQVDISGLFASKSPDKFKATSWHKGPAGSPVLADVAAWFDCVRHEVIEAGDHIILIGRVAGFDQVQVNPLGYCRGAHVTFSLALDKVAASGGRTRVGAILERDGAILLVEGEDGRLDLPAGAALGSGTDAASLTGQLRQLGLKAEIGFLYAVFEDPQAAPGAMSIYYRGTLAEPPVAAGAARLIPLDEIPWERLREDAIRSMLRRYVRERSEDIFGVYVGDAERGTVQTLARSA